MANVISRPRRTRRMCRFARLVSAACLAAPAVLAWRAAQGQAVPTLPTIGPTVYNVTEANGGVAGASIDGGATAVGGANDGTVLQDFMDYASAHGGGTVELPASGSDYLSGVLLMDNNVNLQIDNGATLQNMNPNSELLVTVTTTHDVEISGGGTLDDNAGTAASDSNMLDLEHITNLEVNNVTIENASHEHLVAEHDTNVTINAVNIQDPLAVADGGYLKNTDGIDYSGNNFLIENFTIADGDDDVVAKPSSTPTSNITIENGTITAGHGISIGGQTSSGLNGLTVNNVTFDGSSQNPILNGFHFKAGRGQGGLVQNISINDVTMNNVTTPIDVSSYYQSGGDATGILAPQNVAGPSTPDPISAPVIADDPQTFVATITPQWQNISINGLTVNGASSANVFYGTPDGPNALISGINLSNINYTTAPTNGFNFLNTADITLTGGFNLPIQAATAQNISLSGSSAGNSVLTQTYSATLQSQAVALLQQQNSPTPDLLYFNPSFNPASVNTVATSLLTLGGNPNSYGTYNLNGATLQVSGTETVGFEGTGVLNQTGGANNCQILYVNEAGGSGTYNMNGGTFNATVGVSSAGTIAISGGATFSAGGLFTTTNTTTTVQDSTLTIGGVFSNTAIDGLLQIQGTSTFDVANGTAIEGTGEIEMSGTPTLHTGNYQMLLAVDNFTTVTKAGSDSLTIGGTQAWGVGSELNVTGGTANIQSNPNGVVNVAVNNATVDFQFTNNGQTAYEVGALNIGSNGHAVVDPSNGGPIHSIMTGTLTIANDPGQLDLNDGALVVQDSSDTDHGASELATLSAYAAAGYNGGAWNGDGLMSSVAAADPKHAMAIGMLNNDIGNGEAIFQQFAGQYVSSGDILVRETYYGDGYLNGYVNLDDFDLYLQGLDGSEPATWQYGDYTYSGHVDVATDFRLFALGYYADGGDMNALSQAVASSDMTDSQQVLAQQIIIATVPEPGSAAILAIAGFATLSRRRRRRHQVSGSMR